MARQVKILKFHQATLSYEKLKKNTGIFFFSTSAKTKTENNPKDKAPRQKLSSIYTGDTKQGCSPLRIEMSAFWTEETGGVKETINVKREKPKGQRRWTSKTTMLP